MISFFFADHFGHSFACEFGVHTTVVAQESHSSRVKGKSNQNHEQQHDDEEKMSIFLIKSDFYDASSTPIECGRHNEREEIKHQKPSRVIKSISTQYTSTFFRAVVILTSFMLCNNDRKSSSWTLGLVVPAAAAQFQCQSALVPFRKNYFTFHFHNLFFLSLCLVLLSPLSPFSLLYVSCYTFFIVIPTYKSVSAILIPSVFFFFAFTISSFTSHTNNSGRFTLLATWCTTFGMGKI